MEAESHAASIATLALLVTLATASWVVGCRARRTRVGAHESLKLCALVYNVGDYDRLDASNIPSLPRYMDGIFFTTAKVTGYGRRAFAARGWQVTQLNDCDLQQGTKHISTHRLTSKYLKWNLSEQLRGYDVVVTHDGNVRVDYDRCGDFVRHFMHGSSVAFKSWPYAARGDPVFAEIDSMLVHRPEYVELCRENVKAWRKTLKGDPTYDARPYYETNVFLFRPNCERYRRFGREVFDLCKTMQRDQFVVPYCIQKCNVPCVELEEHVWERELGYRKTNTRRRRN
jgi:hypothetical protein